MSPSTVGALYVVLPVIALLVAPHMVSAYTHIHTMVCELHRWLLSTRLHALSCSAAALYTSLQSEVVYVLARVESFVTAQRRSMRLQHAYMVACVLCIRLL